MKNSRTFDSDLLILDVCDYLFVEWLIRHGLYKKFAANLAREFGHTGSSRQLIRDYIHSINHHRSLSRAILSAFLFNDTPEGYDFWVRASAEWVDFYITFFRK